jgi:hypothetical protein
MLMPPRKWDCNPFVGGYYGRKHNYENKTEDIKGTSEKPFRLPSGE